MKIYHLQDIGPYYARTLKHWRERFFHKLDQIRELGYSDEFIRLWEYYFCYCEGGFIERDIGTVQVVLIKPGNRQPPVML
jgi:cyclopropane-fatty-acyl-phospholipid synthase